MLLYSYIKKYTQILIFLCMETFGHNIPDRLYLKIKFRINMGYRLDLDRPQTYNEKLQWIKLYDRNPVYTIMADKIEVKDYVSELLGGDEHVIPTLGIYENANDIDFDSLPDQFVLKCSHDSGSSIVCVDKSVFNKKTAISKLNKHLKMNYYYKDREWPYKDIKPRIIVEKYMYDDHCRTERIHDYKFFCFNGKVDSVLVCTGRDSNLNYYYFTPNWDFLRWDVDTQYLPQGFTLPQPENLSEMITIAEKLSSKVNHVRVDLYNISGKIYFGEYTFFTNRGIDDTITKECDLYLGDKLCI